MNDGTAAAFPVSIRALAALLEQLDLQGHDNHGHPWSNNVAVIAAREVVAQWSDVLTSAPDADPPWVLGPCRRCGCDDDAHRTGGALRACAVCGPGRCSWYWLP